MCRNSSCLRLLFSPSALYSWLNPQPGPRCNGAYSHTYTCIHSQTEVYTFLRGCFSPVTFYSLISSSRPLNPRREAPRGARSPQQVDSGDTQVWLPGPAFTLSCLHTGLRHYLKVEIHKHTQDGKKIIIGMSWIGFIFLKLLNFVSFSRKTEGLCDLFQLFLKRLTPYLQSAPSESWVSGVWSAHFKTITISKIYTEKRSFFIPDLFCLPYVSLCHV